MAEYSLGSLDVVHLAMALHYEIPVFWTCDDHFERVEEIYGEIIH
jgi:predicted nucleic acid-binding protein